MSNTEFAEETEYFPIIRDSLSENNEINEKINENKFKIFRSILKNVKCQM